MPLTTPIAQTQVIIPVVEVVSDVPRVPWVPQILKEIGRCESGNEQFEKDGTVKRGKQNPKDVGKYQINEFYHLKDSQKLKMDIYTEKGNTEYALYLLKTQGTKPWSWSESCWSKK